MRSDGALQGKNPSVTPVTNWRREDGQKLRVEVSSAYRRHNDRGATGKCAARMQAHESAGASPSGKHWANLGMGSGGGASGRREITPERNTYKLPHS